MEARGNDSDEPMSTTPSPAPIDIPGSMSVGSSPQHSPSNSPAPVEVSSLQPLPLAPKEPPDTSESIHLLRALSWPRADADQAQSPFCALPGNNLPAQVSGQQEASSHNQDDPRGSSFSRSMSDPMTTNSSGPEDSSLPSAFCSVPSNLSSAGGSASNPAPLSDEEDDEVAQIFESDFDIDAASRRSFDHVPKRDYSSVQVLDSCSSSPGFPDGVMLIRPPNPSPELNLGDNTSVGQHGIDSLPTHDPSREELADSERDVGGAIRLSNEAISRSSVYGPGGGHDSSDDVGTRAFGQISTSYTCASGDAVAIGQQDYLSDYGDVPEIDCLQISPKTAKDAFGSGLARSSQRGQKQHRPNPYNRPTHTPQLRKSSSRDSKSDEEKD